MTRKFVQITPHQKPDDTMVTLFAIADDGTAWVSRMWPTGAKRASFQWEPIGSLPDKPEKKLPTKIEPLVM